MWHLGFQVCPENARWTVNSGPDTPPPFVHAVGNSNLLTALPVTHSWYGLFTGFLWGGLVRIFLVNHVVWSINSMPWPAPWPIAHVTTAATTIGYCCPQWAFRSITIIMPSSTRPRTPIKIVYSLTAIGPAPWPIAHVTTAATTIGYCCPQWAFRSITIIMPSPTRPRTPIVGGKWTFRPG